MSSLRRYFYGFAAAAARRACLRMGARGAVSVLLLVAGQAHGQATEQASNGAPEQVQLSYSAGAGCPTQAAFVNEVGARIRRPLEWVSQNPTTLIVVTLGQTDEHASGKLEVTRRGGEPTRREFIASTCAEVGSALALVTALTLDPNARTEALPSSAASSLVGAAETPALAETQPAPVETPPPAPPAPRREPARSEAAPPVPPPRAAYVAWLGPLAGVSIGYAPEPLVSLGLTVGAQRRVSHGLSPSVQLTPSWGKTGTTGPTAAAGSFAWAMARLEACPTELRLAAPLAVAACAAVEAGRLSARGSPSRITPVAAERWWFAAGASASLHFSVGHFFTRLGAHALFPATRDEFVFTGPERHVHEADTVVYGANLGLGFQFGG